MRVFESHAKFLILETCLQWDHYKYIVITLGSLLYSHLMYSLVPVSKTVPIIQYFNGL